MSFPTFEEIREKVSALAIPLDSALREVHWVDTGKIGIAKTSYSAYEIFFVGLKIKPNSRLVGRHLEYGLWEGSTGREYEATRVILPQDSHFLAVASLIAAECAREGARDNSASVQSLFSKVEPIIELALKGGALSDEQLIGLLGELILLEQVLVCICDSPQLFSSVLDMWRGFLPESRDFIIGSNSIEVKTTRSEASRHYIHGISQIEKQLCHNDREEEGLYIFSLGLSSSAHGVYSVSGQTERILDLLGCSSSEISHSVLQNRFLEQLLRYGSSGYNHLEASNQGPYTTTYVTNFVPRLYDMSDPGMLLISTQDLEKTFIDPKHIEFLVELPPSVSHENPMPDWKTSIDLITKLALGVVPDVRIKST